MEIEDSQIFYVSSKNRVSGTTDNFLYSFNMEVDSPYDRVGILSASIPKSYYLIDVNNDEFILTENGIDIDITIPKGNYTLTAWKNTLIGILNSSSPNGWLYNVTFPSPSVVNIGKLSFFVSGNGGLQPSFTFSEFLYKQMGFNPGTYVFVGNKLVSENVIDLQLISAVKIHSDIVNNKSDTVLQEIYSNANDYSNITYQATEFMAYSKKLAIKNNWANRFFLTDSNDIPINLNGLEFNFTIMFFKQNNTLGMIKQYIKLLLSQ